MPWTGEHGDDADDDLPPAPPLPPDDRLWRHPSEVAWSRPPAPPPASPSVSVGRLWAVALTSGLTGAVLALGVVAVVTGFGDGVRERVVERVPLVDDASTPTVPPADSVPAVAASVSPSVVRIDVSSAAGDSSGSGVVFRSDGTILTNAHVVDDADTIKVVLADGTAFDGRVVGRDGLEDVAVLAVEGGGDVDWQPAIIGSADDLEVGETAIAIGSPLGLAGAPSVTVGVISGKGRRVTAGDGTVLHDMIQTDAPIARGSSGGALCNADGVVVGLTTAIAAEGSDVGFATPIDVAKDVAEELLASGETHNAWLGIEGADLPANEVSIPGLDQMGGVEVHGVPAGGPADVAGVQAGDIVVAIEGTRVRAMSDLFVALRSYDPGDHVELRLRRGGQDVTVTVTLAEREN